MIRDQHNCLELLSLGQNGKGKSKDDTKTKQDKTDLN